MVPIVSPGRAYIDLQTLRARREEILDCAAEHGAEDVRVFGSVARGTRGLKAMLTSLSG